MILNSAGVPGASACVVAASEGYPGSYSAGKKITGLDAAAEVAQVFHAGTTLLDGECLTSGGRVLGVTAAADTLQEALDDSPTKAWAESTFDGMYYRRDIGYQCPEREAMTQPALTTDRTPRNGTTKPPSAGRRFSPRIPPLSNFPAMSTA